MPIINYLNYQAETITSSANSVGVMGLYLRDGGVGHHDIDTYPTELNSISFAITNSANIRSARLFVGNSPRGTSITVNGASAITFTNLTNIIAADDDQLAINLRVTFNSTVTDNEQMQFTVSAVTASSLGSQFAAGNGGGASSSVAGDINRIEVKASKLEFTQQPPSVFYTDFIMHPAPTISALDENGNLDLDYSENVTMISSGILTNPQTVASINGVATFLNIVHSTPGLGVFLTVNSNGLNSSLSSSFIIETSAIYHLINNLPGEIQTSYFQNTTCQNNSCNLVINGDFEEFNILPNNISQIQNACGWNGYFTPDYYHSQSPNPNVSIPCNIKGGETVNNNQGNGYAGLFINNMGSEIMVSKLASPLVQGIKYKLSFDVSLAEGNSSFSKSPQAYLSQSLLVPNPFLPITNPQMVFSNNTTSTLANGWETLTFDFTATGGEEYIYFGNFQNMVSLPNPIATNPDCTYNNSSNYIFPNEQPSYYYLDNIRLIAIDDFNLPDTICNINSIPNLFSFLSNAPTDGVFSGAGVIENSGIFSFDATIAGVGIHTISYTYSNSGCSPITITDDITVVTDGIIAEFNALNDLVLCENSTAPVLPTTSDNGITGSWNPSTISTMSSGDYIFTPDAEQCAVSSNFTVIILPENTIVTNDDLFTVSPSSLTTSSVAINDTTTISGNIFNLLSTTIDYSISLEDPIPTFSNGGITLNGNGTFTVDPDTPFGSYTFYYTITTNCSESNQSSVTITYNDYVDNPSKIHFYFCFDGSTYTSTNSSTTYTSLFDLGTVGGVPANSSNATITLQSSSTSNISPSISADGIFTIVDSGINFPGVSETHYEFTYKICSTATNYCSGDIVCHILVRNSVEAIPDVITFFNDGSSDITNINVLENDIKWACLTPTSPLSINDIVITQLSPNNGYYSIDASTGVINVNLFAPVGVYTIAYKICDSSNPGNCSISYASVHQCDPLEPSNPNNPCYFERISKPSDKIDATTFVVVPNPSKDKFEILFQNELLEEATYEVYDVLGKKIINNIIDGGVKNSLINMDNSPKGIYFLRVYLRNTIINQKLIKN